MTLILKIATTEVPLEMAGGAKGEGKVVETLAGLEKLGTYCRFPPRDRYFKPKPGGAVAEKPAEITISISDFTGWLKDNDYEIPADIGGLVDPATITIQEVTVSSKGSFSISFSVQFSTALQSPASGGIFEINEIGLAVSNQ